jgi:hypothetical protein
VENHRAPLIKTLAPFSLKHLPKLHLTLKSLSKKKLNSMLTSKRRPKNNIFNLFSRIPVNINNKNKNNPKNKQLTAD